MDSSKVVVDERGGNRLDSPHDGQLESDAAAGGSALGAVAEGWRSTARLNARMVKRVMREIRPIRSKALMKDALHVLHDRGPTGHDGAFGQVSGKVHEVLAVYRHNHKLSNVVKRSKIRLDTNPQSPVIDAVRSVRGSVVESISYKKSAAGVGRAAANTPGQVTFAVPTDQVRKAIARVGNRATSSDVSRNAVDASTSRGLRALATNEAAGSLARASARAGAIGALSSVALGGLQDYFRHVRVGRMTWKRYAVERGADGLEGAVGSVSGLAAANAAASVIAGSGLATVAFAPVFVPVAAALVVGLAVSQVTSRTRHTVTKLAIGRIAELEGETDRSVGAADSLDPLCRQGAADVEQLPTSLTAQSALSVGS